MKLTPRTLLAAVLLLPAAGCVGNYQLQGAYQNGASEAQIQSEVARLAEIDARKEVARVETEVKRQAARDEYVAAHTGRPAGVLKAIGANQLALGMTEEEALLVAAGDGPTTTKRSAKLETVHHTKGVNRTIELAASAPPIETAGTRLGQGGKQVLIFSNGSLVRITNAHDDAVE